VTAAEASRKEVRLDLEGVTCASCVARIERKLNKLDGVDASVNFATEQATVHCDQSMSVADLVSAVEAAGYHAHPVDSAAGHHHHDEPIAVLRRRLAVAVAITTPLAVVANGAGASIHRWEWVAFALATQVRLLERNRLPSRDPPSARHSRDDGHAQLDRNDRRLGMVDRGPHGRARQDTYFEVAAVITR
jgi:cation transport ATPase